MDSLKARLRAIFTPDLLLDVYDLKYPWPKGCSLDGAIVGQFQFRPSRAYAQEFYDLVFHRALMPLSELPLSDLLAVDWLEILPPYHAEDFPEQSLGLITILDQQRMFTEGYSKRYTHGFFDPLAEKLARRLISLPANARPDSKLAWSSRGYSFDDWLIRTIWFWGPLVHSDAFMTENRADLKRWLHTIRAEVEYYTGLSDPYASLEPLDDVDINAFQNIENAGPPTHGHGRDSGSIARVSDYSFWWIRILNSHFAITDMCGHYPYWIRWKGFDWSDNDREYMKLTKNHRYDPSEEPVLKEIRQDFLQGIWKPLDLIPEYEKQEA